MLPTQSIGKSNEHLLSPGHIEPLGAILQRLLVEIGEGVLSRRLAQNGSGKFARRQLAVLATVARELRVKFGMLVVATHWGSFGLPSGMYDAIEARHGIHAGDIETSLMLSFRRDLVSMDHAKNFISSAIAMEQEFNHLSATDARLRLDRARPQCRRRGRRRQQSHRRERRADRRLIRSPVLSLFCAT